MNPLAREALRQAVERIFGDVPDALMAGVEAALETVHVTRGQNLYRQGEPGDGMHILLTGRLAVLVGDDERHVGDLRPGDVVGEIALFTGGRRGATVVARRDSTLAHLSQARFEAITEQHPQVSRTLARFIIERLMQAQQSGRAEETRLGLIAVVPLDDDVDSYAFASRLQLALLRFGTAGLIGPRNVAAALGPDMGMRADGSVIQLEQYLDAVEAEHDYTVLHADTATTAWTSKCLTYADRVLLVARAGTDPKRAAAVLAARLPPGAAMPPAELVLLHADPSRAPTGTGRWLETLGVTDHHHVVEGRDVGYFRLARFLSGNAVGLVLAGGGARGFAHIGVIRALREAGIPVDVVGGTSIGSIVAGGVALGWDNRKMLHAYRQAFVAERPMSDYTFPVMGLLQGGRMEEGLRRHFGEVEIPDLWLRYFAVSSNLSTNREHVHRTGPLWKAQRASASLPGIFPPAVENGELLIDGGILDNLPVDVMRRQFNGLVIAADLTADDDMLYERERLPGAWEYIRNYSDYQSDTYPAPIVHRVALKATMLSSHRELEAAKASADLYLNPPIGGFDLLAWDRFDELVEIGYRYAREQLAGWVKEHPALVHHQAVTDVRLRASVG